MRVQQFEYMGHYVEIHFNEWPGRIKRFFWTVGTSERRFEGACDYFLTQFEAYIDATTQIDLIGPFLHFEVRDGKWRKTDAD